MGRSNGYRPKAAVRDEVLALRAQLAMLTDDQWAKASCIMDNITGLLGHSGGPMGGKIEPRACKYCHYFGHTKQWCQVRIADEASREELAYKRLLAEDRANGIGPGGYKRPQTEWARWNQLADEAYDELRAMRSNWTDEEWKCEFHKRAGRYDRANRQIVFETA